MSAESRDESPRTQDQISRRRCRRAGVCVVGAGLAGLTTARNLVRAGRSVFVVETL